MRHVTTIAFALFLVPTIALGQTVEPVMSRVRAERAPLLDTLRELVSIESGSRNVEGLNRISDVIADRLRALGGEVEFFVPGADTVRFEDTPEEIGRAVLARFRGTGTANILLLAHMDTVYERGASTGQPFRIDGDRAYGLGIADDKHGVALILHTLAVLNALDFRKYGTLTVLINGDEEISSPGSRALIARLGSEHDVVISCEGGGPEGNSRVQLATTGNGDVILRVTGRASHAGGAPEQGRNALYELAHQILQMRDLSDPATGRKLNWTVASAGTVRNVIPAFAEAMADARVQRVSDWDVIEQSVRELVANTLIADTEIEIVVERRRPPLEPTPGSRRFGEHAREIYAELGLALNVIAEGTGGGTDAAIAALDTQAVVLESFGLQGAGAHSDEAEFVLVSSIEPRLYLLSRMIMDVALSVVQVPAN
jgi:glutamate carboxypeptidase